MDPDFVRHSRPQVHRPLGTQPADRSGELGAGVAAGLAVLVGVAPFILVLQGFFAAMSHGYVGYAVVFGVALASPIGLSVLLGRENGEQSGAGGVALGLWLSVLLLLVAAVLTVGMDIAIGMSGIP